MSQMGQKCQEGWMRHKGQMGLGMVYVECFRFITFDSAKI